MSSATAREANGVLAEVEQPAVGSCCFCAASSPSRHPTRCGRLLGPFRAKSRSGTARALYVHEWCALFAPRVRFTRNIDDQDRLRCAADIDAESLAQEAARGRRIRCALCGEKGAAAGCFRCSKPSYHFGCANAAGLVEWHWWRNHGQRVVHCPAHRDPLCDIWWDGSDAWPSAAVGWFRAAIVDGPVEGRYGVLYRDEPYGEETIGLHDVRLRFPGELLEPRCALWLQLAQLVGVQWSPPVSATHQQAKLGTPLTASATANGALTSAASAAAPAALEAFAAAAAQAKPALPRVMETPVRRQSRIPLVTGARTRLVGKCNTSAMDADAGVQMAARPSAGIRRKVCVHIGALPCMPTEVLQIIGAALDCVSVMRLGSTSLSLNRACFGCGSAHVWAAGLRDLLGDDMLLDIAQRLLGKEERHRNTSASSSAAWDGDKASGSVKMTLHDQGGVMRRNTLAHAYQYDRDGCGIRAWMRLFLSLGRWQSSPMTTGTHVNVARNGRLLVARRARDCTITSGFPLPSPHPDEVGWGSSACAFGFKHGSFMVDFIVGKRTGTATTGRASVSVGFVNQFCGASDADVYLGSEAPPVTGTGTVKRHGIGFAYHGSDGHVSANAVGKVRRAYGRKFGRSGDVISALLLLWKQDGQGTNNNCCKRVRIRYFVNGVDQGVAFDEHYHQAAGSESFAWRPAVGLHSAGGLTVQVRPRACSHSHRVL